MNFEKAARDAEIVRTAITNVRAFKESPEVKALDIMVERVCKVKPDAFHNQIRDWTELQIEMFITRITGHHIWGRT